MIPSRDATRSPFGLALVVSLLSLAAVTGDALARQNIRTSFFGAYPAAVGSRLDNLPSIQAHCGVCHYQFTGAGTRNPYGLALQGVLGNFPNTDAGRRQAIHSIEGQDSDGDGYTQLAEITDLVTYVNTPTFPGLTPANVGQATGVSQSDLLNYLVPNTGADTQDPTVTVLAPNGAEAWEGGTIHSVTWTATDNVGVTSVEIHYRDAEAASWTMIARNLSNSGSFSWHVHNTPTAAARVRVVAYDAAGNSGEDASNAVFAILTQTGSLVATTLRDFHQPGTQPFGGGVFQDRTACVSCHGGYDPAVEPDHNFKGSMMAQAGRDPLFYACVAVAEQDAASAGDLCLRCHTGFGWLSGRSNPTDGALITALDRDGVSCDLCHRAVDPIYQAGVSPLEDAAILAALAPGDTPLGYANGQYVIDPEARRRGPFTDPASPHPFLVSPFHRTSEFCGVCHDVSNPVFARVGGADYAPGPIDEKADSVSSVHLLPLERTYSEWRNSLFNTPEGVYAPDFAGNKPDGIVSICQDCHMPDVEGRGCNDPAAPLRADVPLHDMTGGNAWMPTVVPQAYPGEVDAAALADGAARAVSMLERAAIVSVDMVAEADSFRADVTVTNRTGHKLPTGYPEGRRMWLHVIARDASDAVVYESGSYEPATGVLVHDADLRVYEIELGLSPAIAGLVGIAAGPSFHFALNDTIYKDNRIPPLGFSNAVFDQFGGAPVDPEHPGPGPRYEDGRNWDLAGFGLPASARSVIATLYYQTTSREYVEFLRDENTTNGSGQLLYDLWSANGRAAPVAMAADTAAVDLTGVPGTTVSAAWKAVAGPNPFRAGLDVLLELQRPLPVAIEVFDLAGRLVASRNHGTLGAGTHRVTWDGRMDGGEEAVSGVFWLRVRAGDSAQVRRVVRLR